MGPLHGFPWEKLLFLPVDYGKCDAVIYALTKAYVPGGASDSLCFGQTPGCSWTAQSNANWITPTSAYTGSGSGSISYSVLANNDSNPRSGTITISGRTFTVLQGARFNDVPLSDQFSDFIGKLSA